MLSGNSKLMTSPFNKYLYYTWFTSVALHKFGPYAHILIPNAIISHNSGSLSLPGRSRDSYNHFIKRAPPQADSSFCSLAYSTKGNPTTGIASNCRVFGDCFPGSDTVLVEDSEQSLARRFVFAVYIS